ncbi:MAG TPA: murein biosynthesis integral membrane protein MurJ [Candidatus Binataceae bacterium]
MRDGRGYNDCGRAAILAPESNCRGDLSKVATYNEPPPAGTAPATAAPSGRQSRDVRYSSNLAGLVAAGILLSRIAGLIRESIFAHYLGNSAAADAFKAGFRIPNILQNLFGEGVLSASFIPVYSRLLGEGDEESADLLAWAVGAMLALAISIFVVLGVFAAPFLINVIAPGFHGDKRDLTIRLVRILFPGAGLLVMSAWCLGVLNSHHRFFASYTAPVAWNLVMIGALVWYGPRAGQDRLAIDLAFASVAGAALQIVVQLPQTMPLLGRMRLNFDRVRVSLATVFRNLLPVVVGRGVGQVSGYVDNLLASLLPTGAVAAINYAQILYFLPVSLFGLSVAAAELPSMSRATLETNAGVFEALRLRLNSGLRQIAFFVVPSSAAFIFIGDAIVTLLFQSGAFTHRDAIYVWATVAGVAIGMLAGTTARLYISAFYALTDARTPFRFALVRVTLTLILGYLCAIPLPHAIGIDQRWGVVGLTASAGVAAWVEYVMLRASLNRRLGWTGIERPYLMRLWAMAIAAAVVGIALKLALHGNPRIVALAIIAAYSATYMGLAYLTHEPELDRLAGYLKRRLRRPT